MVAFSGARTTGAVTYIQPWVGCRTRFLFIQDCGVYCVTSRAIHSSDSDMSAK